MNKWKLWKLILVLVTTLLALAFITPTLLGDRVPGWYPIKNRLSFGLDLQGGLELRYTVDYKKAIGDNMLRAREVLSENIVEALATEKGMVPENLTDAERATLMALFKVERNDFDALRITFTNAEDVDIVTADMVKETRPDLIRQIPTGNSVVLKMDEKRVAQIRDEVVNQTVDVIRERVEAFGLTEPDVRKNGDTDIDIQLPGVSGAQVAAVRERIGQTARLAFRILDRSPDALNYFATNEPKLREFKERFPEKGNLLSLEQDRTTGQIFVRANLNPVSGRTDALAKNALISFIKTLHVDEDHTVGYETVENREDGRIVERFLRTHYLFSRADVTGDHLTQAMVQFEQTGEPSVSIEFDSVGARAFEKVTADNVGEYMAIMLDDDVNSAPVIKEKIGGGRARISLGGARHTSEILADAQALVTVLTHGAYKAPVHKVHDFEVGPSLGQDTIDSGIVALIVGMAAIFFFMILYYGGAGLIADFGLLLNVIFTVAILIGFNASLSMPGLAGIVLTVGMAVDANVLIIERMREEIRLGKGPRAIVEAGYDRAFSAIFDGNITTAIAGVILLNFSSGPVYGFAVTLLIGIAVTFVAQVFVTRVVYDWYLDKFRPNKISTGI